MYFVKVFIHQCLRKEYPAEEGLRPTAFGRPTAMIRAQKGISSRRRIKTTIEPTSICKSKSQKGISSRRRIKTMNGIMERRPLARLRKEYPAEEGLRHFSLFSEKHKTTSSERNIQQKKD